MKFSVYEDDWGEWGEAKLVWEKDWTIDIPPAKVKEYREVMRRYRRIMQYIGKKVEPLQEERRKQWEMARRKELEKKNKQEAERRANLKFQPINWPPQG